MINIRPFFYVCIDLILALDEASSSVTMTLYCSFRNNSSQTDDYIAFKEPENVSCSRGHLAGLLFEQQRFKNGNFYFE